MKSLIILGKLLGICAGFDQFFMKAYIILQFCNQVSQAIFIC